MLLFRRTWSLRELPSLVTIILFSALLMVREFYPVFFSINGMRLLVISAQATVILMCLCFIRQVVVRVNPWVVIILGAWFSWIFISTILSEHPWQSLLRFVDIIISVLFVVILAIYLSTLGSFWQQTMPLALIIIPFVCLFYFTLAWLVVDNPRTYNWISELPLFINIRHFGAAINLVLPLGFWFVFKENIKLKIFGYIYLSVCWAMLFWAGGRAPVLTSSLVLIFIILIRPSRVFILCAPFITGILISQLFAVDVPGMSIFRFIHYGVGEKSLDAISSGRVEIFTKSIQAWWDYSPLFGLGADAFRYINPPIYSPITHHPHNVMIELLLSFGIPGLFAPITLFLIFCKQQFAWFCKSGIRHRYNIEISLITFLSILSGLAHAQLSGVLYLPYTTFIWATLMAISLSELITISPTSSASKNNLFWDWNILHAVMPLFLIIILFVLIAILECIKSEQDQVSEQWLAFNKKYPIYLNIDRWLLKSVADENTQLTKELAKIGVDLSDIQQTYENYLIEPH